MVSLPDQNQTNSASNFDFFARARCSGMSWKYFVLSWCIQKGLVITNFWSTSILYWVAIFFYCVFQILNKSFSFFMVLRQFVKWKICIWNIACCSEDFRIKKICTTDFKFQMKISIGMIHESNAHNFGFFSHDFILQCCSLVSLP